MRPGSGPPDYEHRPRKRLGQNFLVDRGVVRRIIEAAALTERDYAGRRDVVELFDVSQLLDGDISDLLDRCEPLLDENHRDFLVHVHLFLEHLDKAIRQLDWEVDARAVFLGSMLAQGELSAKLQPLALCHLQRIQADRSEHPFTHENSEFGALVAAVLSRPAGCPTLHGETAARPALPGRLQSSTVSAPLNGRADG